MAYQVLVREPHSSMELGPSPKGEKFWADFPAHQKVCKSTYSWEEALTGLRHHLGVMDDERVFVRSYLWYYGPRIRYETTFEEAWVAVMCDIRDFRNGGALPAYVFRMYEKEVLGRP